MLIAVGFFREFAAFDSECQGLAAESFGHS